MSLLRSWDRLWLGRLDALLGELQASLKASLCRSDRLLLRLEVTATALAPLLPDSPDLP